MLFRRINKTEQRAESLAGRRAGFTLIELLIVISIIAILALVAVSSYTGVQRQAAVDFAADTLVATIREAEDWSRSGRREAVLEDSEGGESKALCYAVKMVTGVDDGAGLFTAKTDYISVENEIVDSCKLATSWRKSDVFNERIALIAAPADDGVGDSGNGTSRTFYFKPPFGKIFVEDGNVLTPATSQIMTFTIGDPDYPEWNRGVDFDLRTGEAKKVNLPDSGN